MLMIGEKALEKSTALLMCRRSFSREPNFFFRRSALPPWCHIDSSNIRRGCITVHQISIPGCTSALLPILPFYLSLSIPSLHHFHTETSVAPKFHSRIHTVHRKQILPGWVEYIEIISANTTSSVMKFAKGLVWALFFIYSPLFPSSSAI